MEDNEIDLQNRASRFHAADREIALFSCVRLAALGVVCATVDGGRQAQNIFL